MISDDGEQQTCIFSIWEYINKQNQNKQAIKINFKMEQANIVKSLFLKQG